MPQLGVLRGSHSLNETQVKPLYEPRISGLNQAHVPLNKLKSIEMTRTSR